jgi:hypothetical protein
MRTVQNLVNLLLIQRNKRRTTVAFVKAWLTRRTCAAVILFIFCYRQTLRY